MKSKNGNFVLVFDRLNPLQEVGVMKSEVEDGGKTYRVLIPFRKSG